MEENLRFGVYISDSALIGITSNEISNNNGFGLYMTKTDNSIVTKNTISNNFGDVIHLKYSKYNDILDNSEISNNDGYEILLFRSNKNSICGNNIYDNSITAICSQVCVENYFSCEPTPTQPNTDMSDIENVDEIVEESDPNYALWYVIIISSVISIGLSFRYKKQIKKIFKKSR